MPTTTTTTTSKPAPPINHWISDITNGLQEATLSEDLEHLKLFNALYAQKFMSEPDALQFDLSNLYAARKHALEIINSAPPALTPTQSSTSTPPNAGFKPPRMEIPRWSGKSYEFYTWLSACSASFTITNCPEAARTQLMRQAMPLDKTPQFNNISDWNLFKKKLISEFGGISIFAREAHSVFNLIPVYESVQELVEDLAPKIKNLESIIESMKEYHSIDTLYNAVITPDLNNNITRSLPAELRISFCDKYSAFIKLDADNNVRSPAVFKFLNDYVENLNNSYKSNPMLFEVDSSPMNIGIKPVRYETAKRQDRNSNLPAGNNGPRKPCPLCTIKGFESDHYPLNWRCGVKVLCSKEIIKTMDDAKVCPTCCLNHQSAYSCPTSFRDGNSRVCTKKCSHNGHPLNRNACKHNDEAPTVSVSNPGTQRAEVLDEVSST